MLYFKENLVSLAEGLIDAKGNVDDLKAFNYLAEINHALNHYYENNEYSPIYAHDLDSRIRNDYPLIYELERMPPNQTIQQGDITSKGLPPELNNLDVDRYGILYNVLLKKGRVSALKDFLR